MIIIDICTKPCYDIIITKKGGDGDCQTAEVPVYLFAAAVLALCAGGDSGGDSSAGVRRV